VHKTAFCDPNRPVVLAHPQHFGEDFAPFPHANETEAEAQIDQIKKIMRIRKIQERVHHSKLDSLSNPMKNGLFSRVGYHLVTNINPEDLHIRVLFCCLKTPAARTTADIQYAMKPLRIILLRQNSPHRLRYQMVLQDQPL
jgi:hypothetical protein